MKNIHLILLLLSLCPTLSAQNRHFKITGRIEGRNNLKYALMSISEDSKIHKSKIIGNQFTFSGDYIPINEVGMISRVKIYLSDQDTDMDNSALRDSKLWRTEMMMEPKIDFVFDVKKRISNFIGGPLNEIQNVFSAHHERYLIKVDSSFRKIDLEGLDSTTNTNKKKDIKRMLYFEEQAGTLELIEKYSDSEVALVRFIPFTMVPFFNDDRVRIAFDKFSERIRTSKYGIRLNGFLTEMEQQIIKPNMLNKIMPPFELAGLDGQILKSTDLYGTYTLVDFWASWCSPCRAENPNILAAFNNYHQKGFNVVAISIDQLKDKGRWEAAIEKDKTKRFTQLFNPGGTFGIARELNINSVPANYLLDAEGKIIAVDLRGDQLDKKLKELFPM